MLGLWLSCATSVAAQVIAIKAGRLLDPQAGVVLSDQIILVRDNKIEAVGKGLPIPAGAKVTARSSWTGGRASSSPTQVAPSAVAAARWFSPRVTT